MGMRLLNILMEVGLGGGKILLLAIGMSGLQPRLTL
jgi:hypothetical protein